jgi:hypothetical protein
MRKPWRSMHYRGSPFLYIAAVTPATSPAAAAAAAPLLHLPPLLLLHLLQQISSASSFAAPAAAAAAAVALQLLLSCVLTALLLGPNLLHLQQQCVLVLCAVTGHLYQPKLGCIAR